MSTKETSAEVASIAARLLCMGDEEIAAGCAADKTFIAEIRRVAASALVQREWGDDAQALFTEARKFLAAEPAQLLVRQIMSVDARLRSGQPIGVGSTALQGRLDHLSEDDVNVGRRALTAADLDGDDEEAGVAVEYGAVIIAKAGAFELWGQIGASVDDARAFLIADAARMLPPGTRFEIRTRVRLPHDGIDPTRTMAWYRSHEMEEHHTWGQHAGQYVTPPSDVT